jgi:hypothetical protein
MKTKLMNKFKRAGKGNPAGGTKPIEEFFHRGAYSRHEVNAWHTPKAALAFRGKGSKVERRSNRSKARRKKEG